MRRGPAASTGARSLRSAKRLRARRASCSTETSHFLTASLPRQGPPQDALNIGRAPAATQAINGTTPHAARAGRVHLVLGPVGAGKSTFAQRLAQDHSGIRLTLDDWMVTLFRPDRPASGVPAWYQERAERCIDQIWKLAQQLGARGDQVVLEIGLLRRAERERFYERVSEAGLPLTLYVLDAEREVRRARVAQRNERQGSTFSMVVPPEIFELASDLWQAIEPDESEGLDVRFVCTDP